MKKENKKDTKNCNIFSLKENGTKRPNKNSKNINTKKVVFTQNFVIVGIIIIYAKNKDIYKISIIIEPKINH